MSVLHKYPEETRQYAFEFEDQPEISGGQTLASSPGVSATRTAGSGTLTLGAPSIVGSQVLLTLSGGTQGDQFTLVCTVTTSSGAILAAKGELHIDRV